MFSSQLGRVCARSGTQAAASHSTLASAAHRSSTSLLTRQRRLSSSKASCPPNGDSNRASRQAPAQASGSASPTASPKPAVNAGGRKSSRPKSKDKHEVFDKLPSVPPTDHLRSSDITISSFFGMHRPLSLTATFPPSADMTAFNSIFEPKPTSKSAQDVVYTLSSAISSLDSQQASNNDLRWEIVQEAKEKDANVHHLDGIPRAKSLEELVGQLRPFTAPPPPVPAATVKPSRAAAPTAPAMPTSQKTFKTTIIVTEKTAADGHKYYTAETTPMEPIKEPKRQPTAPFKDRMRQRQMGQLKEGQDMHAISVKRQRKLKMKKHKYKKLMKRTRNLRRRLDRN